MIGFGLKPILSALAAPADKGKRRREVGVAPPLRACA
jgi:hypothetical protein